MDIYTTLFDQEQVLKDYLESEQRKIREDIYVRLRKQGVSEQEAQEITELNDWQVRNTNRKNACAQETDGKDELTINDTQKPLPEPLLDQEQIIHDYVASEMRIVREATREECRIRFFVNLRKQGVPEPEAKELAEITDDQIEKANALLQEQEAQKEQ